MNALASLLSPVSVSLLPCSVALRRRCFRPPLIVSRIEESEDYGCSSFARPAASPPTVENRENKVSIIVARVNLIRIHGESNSAALIARVNESSSRRRRCLPASHWRGEYPEGQNDQNINQEIC